MSPQPLPAQKSPVHLAVSGLMSDPLLSTGPNQSAMDVTVVVPTRNAGRTLKACLKSLRAQTHPCRIVVVDNGSTDGTQQVAERWADFLLHAGPERSAQRNLGARTYPADFLGFIDADMVLEPGVVQEAVALLRGGAGSVIIPEHTVGTGFWVEVRAFERSFYTGSDAIEAPRFFRRDVFEGAGGFDEQLTGPEDWDLGQAVRRLAPVARTASSIAHDEGSLGYVAACGKKAHYAVGMRRYLAKHGRRAFLDATRRPWLSRPWRLGNRRGMGLVALKAGEALTMVAVWGWSAMTAVHLPLPGGSRRAAGPPSEAVIEGGLSDQRGLAQSSEETLSRLWRHARTAARVFLGTRNGGGLLATLAVAALAPNLIRDVTFETREGLRLAAPARDYHWWPIVEVVVDDCYRLSALALELPRAGAQVLDVGAHVGAFSCALAQAVPGSQVTAVEPSAERVGYLRRNVAGNKLEGRVTVLQAAVAGQGGRRRLSPFGILDATPARDLSGEWVDLVAFEELLASFHGPIDLVKMDCEGSEYEIVASASAMALGRIRRLLLEYHPASSDEIRQLFARLADAGLTERWRRDDQPGQLGVVYLSRETG
jgi:FkbM family methyltransferase